MNEDKCEGKTMDTFLDSLLTSTETETENAFKPVARYFIAMDSLIYLNKDLSYRADRVDGRLTLLWHPYEDTLIGIKLKGFRHIFETLRALSDNNLEKRDFIPIVKYLELALFGSAEAMITSHQEKRKQLIEEKYSKAKEFLNHDNVGISSDEIDDLAA